MPLIQIPRQEKAEPEFKRRMQEWGKLGGRPKGSASAKAKKGGKRWTR